MSTKKIVTVTIILLLLANLGLLAFIMMKPQHPRNGMRDGEHNPKNQLIKRLDFDESQSKVFSELVKSHHKAIVTFDEKIKTDKELLYSLLSDETPNLNTVDSLTSNIARFQKQIELLHFAHFKEVKALCKGEQVEKFNELSNDLAKIFIRKGKKSGRRKKE